MPLAFDKDRTVDVWLASDEVKPLDVRPVFVVRYPTVRQYRKIREVRAKLRADNEQGQLSDEAASQAMIDAISPMLCGRRNLPDGDLCDLLTVMELYELTDTVLARTLISEMDLKKSVTPLESNTGQSLTQPAA